MMGLQTRVPDGVALLYRSALTTPVFVVVLLLRQFLHLSSSPVLCRLDYGNGTLVCLPAYILSADGSRLKMWRHSRYDRSADAVVCLHWLRSPERITCIRLFYRHQALHRVASLYFRQFVRVADVSHQRNFRSVAIERLIFRLLNVQLWAVISSY